MKSNTSLMSMCKVTFHSQHIGLHGFHFIMVGGQKFGNYLHINKFGNGTLLICATVARVWYIYL